MSEPQLSRELETILGMRRMGYPFTSEWCVSELFKYVDWHSKFSREVVYWSLVSALRRSDFDCARRYVRDWSSKFAGVEPKVWDVSKFVPGDHYHVDGTKFDTLKQAQDHIERKGCRFGRLIEKHVYNRPGD